MDDLNELRERLINADTTLKTLAEEWAVLITDPRPEWTTQQVLARHTHLTSKAEGVRLALSYVDELIRRNNAEVQDSI